MNSGGSPIGVRQPPQLLTMKMNITMCRPVMRYRFDRIQGRISSIDAPVVPMRLESTAPTARKIVFAIGVASHGIGTARAFQVSEQAGAFAALAMGLNGALTALLLPLVLGWMR